MYILVVIALVNNVNVITIFITDTVSYSRYHCSFIPVDIVITACIIITVSVIVSYHRYRHHYRDNIIFSLICMSDLFLLSVSFRADRCVTNSPASLAYRDVFVLTKDYNLHDEVRNDAGNVTSPASGVVVALRHAQIPVCVLERRDRAGYVAGWESRVADVAVSRTDEVTVAHCGFVQGLERRVVVCLTYWPGDIIVYHFRLPVISRCTTQLIIVNTPSDRQRHRNQRQHTPQPHLQ